MAIEHRALFALSIAFTASIVALPDFPPDIPPVRNVFIGRLILAFLLPVTAAAIWWLLGRLHRGAIQHLPASDLRPERVGPATALFLSAFHVTMLIALIGGHLWLGRILGLMVGMFLIATGNELPRLRPNLVWGIRTPQTLGNDDVWKRVHRLGGHIRVVMGLAVCIAALSGTEELTQVILVAVGLETVVCVGAGMVFSRHKTAVLGVLLLSACGVGARVHAQGLPPAKVETLPALIDATVPKLMEQGHVPGAAVVIVHEGRIVVLRGFGESRLDSGQKVDASRTLFRIGSVSKVFTAVAALQLVEARKLDLQQDIRAYLPDFPLRYGATTHQLLTHTAGLEERFAGAYTDAPEHLVPLATHLRLDPPKQVIRPGTAYSYSNYNYALAGLVVESLSGVRYETYMADRVFGPLRMTATTAHQPPEAPLANDLARGYRWVDGHHEVLPYRFTYASPSGAISTSAADMGRFMLALLGDGTVGNDRVLSPESVQTLLAPQYTPDPRVPPRGYGFLHWLTHGQRLQHHDGTLGDQVGVLVLAPAHRFGIFVASNGVNEGGIEVGNTLLEPLLTHLFGPSTPPPPPTVVPDSPDSLRRALQVAGTYRDYHHTRNDMSRLRAMMPMIQSRATVEPDGAIRWHGRRWLEVEPLVFRRADGPDHIIFKEDDRGNVTALHAWGATYERIGWIEQTPVHLGLLALCVIAFLAYPLSRVVHALRRRPAAPEGRVARGCAVFVALANLAFVIGLVPFLRNLGSTVPLPLPQVVLLSLPLASVAATALLPAFSARAWTDKWWSFGERLRYSALAVFAVAFMTFLNYWKLLGFRY
jgi:CubicO group peptidase (beta-lactamase class C family)